MTRGSLWAAGCRVLQFLLRWPVRVFKKVRQNKLGIFFNVFVCLFVFCSKPLLPKGQFLDQHQQHRLRACWMCGPSSPRPGQPRQKLTFDKAPDNSSAQCSLRSPGLNDKDGVRVFCLAGGPRGLSTPCLFSLSLSLRTFPSALCDWSPPFVPRLAPGAYALLSHSAHPVALIRDSPAWPRPGDSHRPWRRDRKALHLPRCAIHGQWIPSPLPSLCRSSKKEETKRNPLRHGTVRAGRDRRGKARRGKAHKGVVGGEGQAREPGKLPRTRTG